MSSHKHTPGPWRSVGSVNHQHIQKSQLILQAGYDGSAKIDAMNIASLIPCAGMTAQEVEANGLLIATAPDMLMALEYASQELIAHQLHQRPVDIKKVLERIHTAIGKALPEEIDQIS